MNISKLRNAVSKRNIEWNKHSLAKMLERGILKEDAIEVLMTGEEIEDYPEDKPYPSALFFGTSGKNPIHVVAALNEKSDICYVITVYSPDTKHFEPDFKTRKKK